MLEPGAALPPGADTVVPVEAAREFTARLEKSPRGEYELTDAINAMVAAHRRIAGMQIEGRWVDVRDPEVLSRLEQETLSSH